MKYDLFADSWSGNCIAAISISIHDYTSADHSINLEWHRYTKWQDSSIISNCTSSFSIGTCSVGSEDNLEHYGTYNIGC